MEFSDYHSLSYAEFIGGVCALNVRYSNYTILRLSRYAGRNVSDDMCGTKVSRGQQLTKNHQVTPRRARGLSLTRLTFGI